MDCWSVVLWVSRGTMENKMTFYATLDPELGLSVLLIFVRENSVCLSVCLATYLSILPPIYISKFTYYLTREVYLLLLACVNQTLPPSSLQLCLCCSLHN